MSPASSSMPAARSSSEFPSSHVITSTDTGGTARVKQSLQRTADGRYLWSPSSCTSPSSTSVPFDRRWRLYTTEGPLPRRSRVRRGWIGCTRLSFGSLSRSLSSPVRPLHLLTDEGLTRRDSIVYRHFPLHYDRSSPDSHPHRTLRDGIPPPLVRLPSPSPSLLTDGIVQLHLRRLWPTHLAPPLQELLHSTSPLAPPRLYPRSRSQPRHRRNGR